MQPLSRRGVKFFPEPHYTDVAGKRTRVSIDDTLDRVWVPITDSQWADTMIRERPDYLGGCCTMLDEAQDHILGVMRDDGMIQNSDLLEIGMTLRKHGGFDAAAAMTDSEYEKLIAGWDQLGAVDRISLVFNAAEPLLKQRPHQTPRIGETTEDTIHTLASALRGLSWADLFSHPTEADEADHHMRRLEAKAQILPLLRGLFEQLDADDELIDGYALVDKGTETILSNQQGLCIYASKEAAKQVITVWEHSADAAYDLREAQVSVSGGVQLGATIDMSD